MVQNLPLIQALNSRIMHDLSSSIGTIYNSISLLDISNRSIQQKAKTLLTEESVNLVKKLKFFQNTYGVTEQTSVITTRDFNKELREFFEGSLIELELFFANGISTIDPMIARALKCLVVISRENMNDNGQLKISFGNTENKDLITMNVGAENLRLKEACINSLVTEDIPLSPENCREHYVRILFFLCGYKIEIDKGIGVIEYNFVKL